MPCYMHQFKYKDDGIAQMLRNGGVALDRRQFVQAAAEVFRGRLLSFHYCFGEFDGVALTEFPNEASAFACVAALFAQGRVQTIQTTQLITSDDGMAAFKMARDKIPRD